VFISYASEDATAAFEIVAELESRDIPCWIAPRDVRPGRQYRAEIVEAIRKCRAVVLVFSARCNKSEHVGRELTLASDLPKDIIPIRIESAKPEGELEYTLAGKQWIDGFPSRQNAIDEIVRTFQADLDPTTDREKDRQPPPPRRLSYAVTLRKLVIGSSAFLLVARSSGPSLPEPELPPILSRPVGSWQADISLYWRWRTIDGMSVEAAWTKLSMHSNNARAALNPEPAYAGLIPPELFSRVLARSQESAIDPNVIIEPEPTANDKTPVGFTLPNRYRPRANWKSTLDNWAKSTR
jgi:hypothetical protein